MSSATRRSHRSPGRSGPGSPGLRSGPARLRGRRGRNEGRPTTARREPCPRARRTGRARAVAPRSAGSRTRSPGARPRAARSARAGRVPRLQPRAPRVEREATEARDRVTAEPRAECGAGEAVVRTRVEAMVDDDLAREAGERPGEDAWRPEADLVTARAAGEEQALGQARRRPSRSRTGSSGRASRRRSCAWCRLRRRGAATTSRRRRRAGTRTRRRRRSARDTTRRRRPTG